MQIFQLLIILNDSSYLAVAESSLDSSEAITLSLYDEFTDKLLVLFSSNLSSIAPISFSIFSDFNIWPVTGHLTVVDSNPSHRKINPIISQMEKFSRLRVGFFLLPTISCPQSPHIPVPYSLTDHFVLPSFEWTVDPYSYPLTFVWSISMPLQWVSFRRF